MPSVLRRRLNDLISRYYSAEAKAYDEFAASTSASVAPRLLELAGVTEGDSVLDLGTGTGVVALLAASQVGSKGSVLGIDIAPAMLAVARRKASAAGVQNVRFRRMDAARLRLPRDSFDSAFSNFGIPVDSFPEVASAVLRILKSGGTFCFSEAADHSAAHHAVSKVFSKYKTSSPSPGLKRSRELWASFAKLVEKFPPSEFEALIKMAGFSGVRVTSEAFAVPFQSPSTSLSYWIDGERAEYAALSSEKRGMFRTDALHELERLAKASGGVQKRVISFWLGKK